MTDNIFKAKPFKYTIQIQNNDTNEFYTDFCVYCTEPSITYLKAVTDRFEQIVRILEDADIQYHTEYYKVNRDFLNGITYRFVIGKLEE